MPRKLSETVQVNLRIKESFRRRLKDAAERRGLSLNEEMVRRLTNSFDEEDERVRTRVIAEGSATIARGKSVDWDELEKRIKKEEESK